MDYGELLEMAAKAVGWIAGDVVEMPDGIPPCMMFDGVYDGKTPRGYWRPLEDDGDALRLASKLRLSIHDLDNWIAISWDEHPKEIEEEARSSMSDEVRCELLRRAIVRAAAEIGKSLK